MSLHNCIGDKLTPDIYIGGSGQHIRYMSFDMNMFIMYHVHQLSADVKVQYGLSRRVKVLNVWVILSSPSSSGTVIQRQMLLFISSLLILSWFTVLSL